MFHDDVLIFDVIVLQSRSIVQIDEEDLGDEELDDLAISLHWEHLLFGLLVLDLYQVQLVLIVKEGNPPVAHFYPFDVVFALNFVDLLAS
jgi:hypothetical protein